MNFSTINMQSSNGTSHTLKRKGGIKYFTKQSLLLRNTPQFLWFIPCEVTDCGIENFEFFVSERVQVNPDNSLAECVNIFIIQTEYTAKKSRCPKPWCNDSGVLNLHHGYYTTIMTSRRLFRHK